jgi:7-cyano-7-deazaguanine synthase in queuosine biosynthesis
MPGFFKRPDPDKNFFYNYFDHLKALTKHSAELYEEFKKLKTSDAQIDFFEKELSNRNLILNPLRDAHDYMDEVMGATVLPAFGMLTAVGALVVAAWEGVQALAIHCGFAHNDREKHADEALSFFIAAAAAFTLSAMSFVKSWISLVSRPIATVEQGFAKQDTLRFYNEDKEPVVEAARKGMNEAIDGAASVLNSIFK